MRRVATGVISHALVAYAGHSRYCPRTQIHLPDGVVFSVGNQQPITIQYKTLRAIEGRLVCGAVMHPRLAGTEYTFNPAAEVGLYDSVIIAVGDIDFSSALVG